MSSPRMPYKIRGPQTWARVRKSYLNGAPANVLAERFDVTVAAIRMRAKREGWRKMDGEGAGGAALPDPLTPVYLEPGERPVIDDPRELAHEAVGPATAACARGGWTRRRASPASPKPC